MSPRSPAPAPDEEEHRLARLVHELRSPLTAMLGYADQLIDDLADRVDALQRLHVLRDNGEHLLQLVNGITHRARTDDAHPVDTAWASQELDPIETIATVVQLLRPCAEVKGLSLTARAEPPLPVRIPTDPLRVRQVLFNLVGNAIKFTAEGGVLVTASVHGVSELRFAVTDSGPGVAEERRPNLFHPFETGDGASGDGLGLYISSRLAQAMGGRLTLDASGPDGCTFTLSLPLEPDLLDQAIQPGDPRIEALDRIQREGPSEGPLAGLRILVVEHGPDHQLLLSAVLKRAGSRVSIAGTGMKALQDWQQAERTGVPYDLVVVSEHLARKDGTQLIHELRGLGYTGPALGTIEGSSKHEAHQRFEAVCDSLLEKPIDPAVLRAAVASCTDRSGPKPRSGR